MDDAQPKKDLESAAVALVEWLGGLRPGAPLRWGPLAVVPVYGRERPVRPVYRTLAEALASGQALVSEQAFAHVPALQVLNQGPLPILILDGEEVVGGKQNRVVNTTLLVPAKTAFDLPVSCVEHGRWHDAGSTFQTGEAAYPSLRRQKAEQVTASFFAREQAVADQGAVWEEIAARHRQSGVRSATGAMRDAYAGEEEVLARAEHALVCPADGPVGVVALVGGRAACADVFDRPETLRAYWPRLVRSYALEAADSPPAKPSLNSALRLLRRPAKSTRTPFRSPGLGVDLRIGGNGVVGAALVHGGAVLHTALFRRSGRHADGPLQSPGQRARRLGR